MGPKHMEDFVHNIRTYFGAYFVSNNGKWDKRRLINPCLALLPFWTQGLLMWGCIVWDNHDWRIRTSKPRCCEESIARGLDELRSMGGKRPYVFRN